MVDDELIYFSRLTDIKAVGLGDFAPVSAYSSSTSSSRHTVAAAAAGRRRGRRRRGRGKRRRLLWCIVLDDPPQWLPNCVPRRAWTLQESKGGSPLTLPVCGLHGSVCADTLQSAAITEELFSLVAALYIRPKCLDIQ